jgi:acyl transferase domain-containing protein
VEKLCESGHELFVEVSPHPILLPSIEEALESKGAGARR